MDDLLKAYAKKRREAAGAPLDLHPATRNLLQAEVTKLRPASRPGQRSWFRSWLAYWPQLTATASILVVLGVGYRVLLQEQDGSVTAGRFAKSQATEAEVAAAKRPNEPAPTADLPGKAENGRDRSDAFRNLAEAPSPSAPGPARDSKDKDAARPAAETTVRQLAKLGGAKQAVPKAPEEKSLLTRNEPSVERVAQPFVVTAPATPPPAAPLDLGGAISPLRLKAADPDSPPLTVPRTVTLADEATARAPSASGIGGPAPAPPPGQYLYRRAMAPDQRGAGDGQRQRFTQTPQPAGGLKSNSRANATQGVLASFEMQQDGAQLRAIDADGSIYEGRFNEGIDAASAKPTATAAPIVPPLQVPANRPAAGRAGGAAAVEAAKPGQPGVRFRLAGTNQTLKQLVVFEGTLTEGAPPPAAATQAGATASSAEARFRELSLDVTSRIQSPLLARPIQGTLRIGTSNAVPVQAVPVGR
jgi:hypothetical protein